MGPFLPAAKPSGLRAVQVVVVIGVVVVGRSSLSEHSSVPVVVYFSFINSLWGGIRLLNQIPFA